jgi:hypothetical protein
LPPEIPDDRVAQWLQLIELVAYLVLAFFG